MRRALRRLFFRYLPRRWRHALLERGARIDPDALRGITVKVVETAAEVEEAARLLHDSYVESGLTEPHPSGLRVTPQMMLPKSVIFIAEKEGKVIGTLTLVPDSDLGLPMESAFPESIRELRAMGRQVGEVGALSIAKAHRSKGVAYLLFKIMWRTAREVLHLDDLVVSVREHLEPLYECLVFRRMGGVRSYPGIFARVRAVALRQNMQEAVDHARGQRVPSRPSACNPASIGVRPVEAEIKIPYAPGQLERAFAARLQAAPKLLGARGDMLQGLGREERRVLRAHVPSLRPLLPSLTDGAHTQPGALPA